MTAVMKGVRIVEVAEHTFVPAASALLADWGAEVIKIEPVERLAPYANLVIDAFGPGRVMWGSDWPVLRLAGDYEGWLTATHALLADRPNDARTAILGGTARRFYGLEAPSRIVSA